MAHRLIKQALKQTVKQTVKQSIGLIVICLIFVATITNAQATNSCSTKQKLKKYRIAYVSDGDTLALVGGKKVRLLGINTPEIKHKASEQDQPYGRQAKTVLTRLLKSKTIWLLHGTEKSDRYNRWLAWAFTEDKKLVAESLIKQGFAFQVATWQDTIFAKCLKQAEDYAKANKLGIWSHRLYQPQKLTNLAGGFGIFTGKIKKITSSKNDYWAELNGDLVLKFNKENWQKKQKFIYNLKNKTVVVKGWVAIRRSKKYKNHIMKITHPAMLEII